jgi:S-formylglutathione hydrolase FrmB
MRSIVVISFILMALHLRAAQIDTIDLYSPSMKKYIRNLVVKPAQYQRDTAAYYPVAYLLHGWSGNFTGWLGDAPQLIDKADEYQCVLVFPDGGYDSWYLDSKVDSTVRYETYITKELIPFIDTTYRTLTEKPNRAICGLSMGGHGALYLTIRNQDLFGAAGSICGGVDLRPFTRNDWDLEGVLGNPKAHWKNWENASIVHLVPQISEQSYPHLIIDCGLGDFFLDVNRSLHHKLVEHQIPHEYTERPGEHTSEYWCNAVDFQMLFFAKLWGRK